MHKLIKNFTLFLAFLSLSFLTSCDNDDDTTNPVDFPVEGEFYRLNSLSLTEAVDANNDGIYSVNLMDEIACVYSLRFENNKSNNPAATGIDINVTDDGNGNMEQRYSCSSVSATFPLWLQRDNIIYFYFQGETWESATYIAELSSDNRSLSFEMSMDLSPIFGREILREDGTLIQYQGTAQLIYTLEE
jgi:hypothetical protein